MNELSIIDTHCHYNRDIMDNLDEQIDIANANSDVFKIVNIGLNCNTSKQAIKTSLEHSKFYATLGVHPLYHDQVEQLEEIYEKYDHTKIVAIGETGIDTTGNISNQIEKFLKCISLANRLKLPLIIHANTTKGSNVDANKICIEIIKRYKPKYGFVFHCFQPDLKILEEIINLEGYISVASNITKLKAKKSLEVVKTIPISQLLIETDYPFLADDPNKTGKETFNKICELKETNKVLMMNTLNNNATRLFSKLH